MPLTLQELLAPQVIVDTISKVSKNKGPLSRLFGMNLGGKNIKKVPVRHVTFRIFNHTRQPAMFTAPDSPPAVVAANPVGEQKVTMARIHQKMVLDMELMGNLAKISGPNSQIDEGGQEYIYEQEQFMGEMMNAAVECCVAGLIRGTMYLGASGSNYIPYLSAPSGNYITVDWQVPAGNKSQLNMLGAGSIIGTSWDDAAAPIIQNVYDVRSAFVQLTGMPMSCVLVNASTWKYIVTNTEVRNVGGTVQSPIDAFTWEDAKDEDGYQLAGMGVGRLRAIPWLKWYVIDDVLSIGGTDPVYSTGDGTLTKIVPDNIAVFMPEPEQSWVTMCHGAEYIAEDVGKMPVKKQGLAAWHSISIEPTQFSLVSLLNLMPFLAREKALAIGTVIF